jgi:hypothetical protein
MKEMREQESRETDEAYDKLRRMLKEHEEEEERFRYVDALLSSVDVTLAPNKAGNEQPLLLGRLRDNLTSLTYRELCRVLHAAFERERGEQHKAHIEGSHSRGPED